MKHRFLALAACGLALGIATPPAMADDPFAGQAAEQVAGSQQSASSNASSTQYQPSNSNISVRVLSPGDDGAVSQTNSSTAVSGAGNWNSTEQTLGQAQSGSGGGAAVQEAAQEAVNQQAAESNAESTQIAPSNRNINVRVLSPGDNGSVTQSNNSEAKSGAGNANELAQEIEQVQRGGCCAAPAPAAHQNGYSKDAKDACCHGGTGVQAAGQLAVNKQWADSSAKSTQIKPSNSNISVRVLSPGDDGDVEQSNSSEAKSAAVNLNDTYQAIGQAQALGNCRCKGGESIQAAGQAAFNKQAAESDAESKQIHPANKALGFRFKSWGDGGYLSQSNDSAAVSFAANGNALSQVLRQLQGA